MDDTRARLEALETRNAYQEATIEDLSTQIYHQQLTIERLVSRVETLTEKVKSLASGENAPLPDNERPPHY